MRQLATIQEIVEIQPIEGADAIEKVRVKEWWVVAKKGDFKVGDLCVYFEIDSLLPDIELYSFLKKGSTLKRMVVEGQVVVGIRLKTIKLRGQISQGLVMPLSIIPTTFTILGTDGQDVTDALGVIKYDPPLPAELQGKAKGFFPSFIPKTDEERIQNMAEILSGYYVSEKIDGTSVTYFKKDGVFGVCSRNLELQDVEGNTQWRLARELGLVDKIPDNFALQGELVGVGVQGNPLTLPDQRVYFFNAYNITSGKYLNFEDFKGLCVSLGIQTVPIVVDNFSLPSTAQDMLQYAEGKSLLNPLVEREGVVVRPKVETSYNGARLSFKAISNKYLLNESD